MAPEQRREHLLDAALSVIVDQGYSGVSIEAVARAAGVTRPVVYDHFPNLGRLLFALIEREERYALDQLAGVVPPDADDLHPTAVLSGGMRRFLDAVASRPATWRIILLPPEGTPTVVRQQIEKNRARTLDRVEELARAMIARPGLPDDLDAELTARAIRDLAEGAGRMVLTDPAAYPPARYERLVASLAEVLWPPDASDN